MKSCPRWAAVMVALTVILTSIFMPLEGAAAPGPIALPEDPKSLFGDPDIPTNYSLREVQPELSLIAVLRMYALERLVAPFVVKLHSRGTGSKHE